MDAAGITVTRGTRPTAIAAAALSLLLVAVTATQWWLVEWLTPFLMPLVLGLVWISFLGISAWSLVWAVRNRAMGRRVAIPLLICAATFLVVLMVPFTELWLRLNFAWYKGARERVVQEVQLGVLRPNSSDDGSLITLGPSRPNVSMGGNEIVVETHNAHTYVFFFTYRGILDNYSGFLHVPDGGDPREYSDLSEADKTQIVSYGDHWFYAAHR